MSPPPDRRSPPPTPVPVAFSSCVSTICYDEETSELIVLYTNGKEYHYSGVEPDRALSVMQAPSVGEALARNIKGRYAYSVVGG